MFEDDDDFNFEFDDKAQDNDFQCANKDINKNVREEEHKKLQPFSRTNNDILTVELDQEFDVPFCPPEGLLATSTQKHLSYSPLSSGTWPSPVSPRIGESENFILPAASPDNVLQPTPCHDNFTPLKPFQDNFTPPAPCQDKNRGHRRPPDPSPQQGKRPRLFPGPAGLLPRLGGGDLRPVPDQQKIDSNIDDNNEGDDKDDVGVTDCPTWTKAVEEMRESATSSYSTRWIREKLSGGDSTITTKIPVFLVKLVKLDLSKIDPLCILVDKEGEVEGNIHRDVMESYGQEVQVGSVLLLRNVVVLLTGRKEYVNITINNLVTIYSSQSDVNQIKRLSREEIEAGSKEMEGMRSQLHMRSLQSQDNVISSVSRVSSVPQFNTSTISPPPLSSPSSLISSSISNSSLSNRNTATVDRHNLDNRVKTGVDNRFISTTKTTDHKYPASIPGMITSSPAYVNTSSQIRSGFITSSPAQASNQSPQFRTPQIPHQSVHKFQFKSTNNQQEDQMVRSNLGPVSQTTGPSQNLVPSQRTGPSQLLIDSMFEDLDDNSFSEDF